MTLNLCNHEKDIKSAYQTVIRCPENWLILDYEGNSNVLKVADGGDGGLEELVNNFTIGKLQYGIISMRINAASPQSKIIMIQWSGGVPASGLAYTANHANDLKRFLRGIHVVINATSDDDVDYDSILRILNKLPGVNDQIVADQIDSRQAAVGSVYSPVKPQRDFDVSDREEFWKRADEEETSRRIEERQRENAKNAIATEENNKLSREIHERFHWNEDHIKNERGMKHEIMKLWCRRSTSTSSKNVQDYEDFGEDASTNIVGNPGDGNMGKQIRNEISNKLDNIYSENHRSTGDSSDSQMDHKNNTSGYQINQNLIANYADETEITFDPDDIISEIEQIDEGWWRGRGPDGRYGLFPANYVAMLN
ncbi:unnamed protein product [Dracunculus medinensis]|uniref:Drebrin-like protein n=1 Tax=Dracunculus medinensis TaxID=318479 RepID=A0A0N4UJS3_DRAME|nr:unnamed protein product [Dracunculus medinensis]